MRPPLLPMDRLELEASADLRAAETTVVSGYDCDGCECHFEGSPAGSGLFVWVRGEEVRYEEPPLCDECASKVTLGALLSFQGEEEEG